MPFIMDQKARVNLESESDLGRHYRIGEDMRLYVADEPSEIGDKVRERAHFAISRSVGERAYGTASLETKTYGFSISVKNWGISPQVPEPDELKLRSGTVDFEKLVVELMKEAEASFASVTGNADIDFVKEKIREYRSWRKQNLNELLALYGVQ